MKRPHDIKALFLVYYGSELLGQTFAVSSRQAINNVRHNYMGDTTSQYSDPGMWKAIEDSDIEGGNKC